ncbi:sirohydrochlorin chelatase [Nonomuraea sp. SBT364]|uniref:sirohydrochlorin chelatase n=1 Tax=Nonomuraea sp. SBT364 TaxID=1580530 RepID=UPI00066C4996|nr:CbiX/SirB N-terminal domain-containing protein [Nonomuraea sp. SBT364]
MRPAQRPALVLVAHGTRSVEGERTLAALAAAVRRARPGVRVEQAYLEISSPPLPAVLAAAGGPVVVVPLLLAGGYHVHIDLPAVVAAHRPDAVVAGQLGPHDLLTGALAGRLEGAGLRDGDAVVLGAAGSSDPSGLDDVRAAARLLSARLSRPVTAAFVSCGAPALDEALERARATSAGRVAVASYLLAPGFFHGRLLASGAGLVSDPLGDHPGVVSLVWHRYDAAVRAQPAAGSSRSSRTISSALTSRSGTPYVPTNSSM